MSKRCGVRDFYGAHKKLRTTVCSTSNTALTENDTVQNAQLPSDTESAITYLKSTFPLEKFNEKLPPVLLVHQIYSIVQCKTTVDKQIRALQSKGTIRLFKLGGEETAFVIIYTEDLQKHISKNCPQKHVVNIFVNDILPSVQDVIIEKSILKNNFSLSDSCISELMNCGLLAARSITSFWFSFPNAGEFMKTYLRGRKSVIRTIRKCKFSEILQNELEQRKLEKQAKLGMKYHIHDIIGAELVQCVETTSGTLLRLKKEVKNK
ncbi:hypothetical protein R5R35_013292 [Gryllus longicercus]|uniref:Serine/threonine-protein kinase 19 n=1 Tax=Gryllus longicercus TaxID=2509291 RepID=A0AAN9V1Q1_9ORTH